MYVTNLKLIKSHVAEGNFSHVGSMYDFKTRTPGTKSYV